MGILWVPRVMDIMGVSRYWGSRIYQVYRGCSGHWEYWRCWVPGRGRVLGVPGVMEVLGKLGTGTFTPCHRMITTLSLLKLNSKQKFFGMLFSLPILSYCHNHDEIFDNCVYSGPHFPVLQLSFSIASNCSIVLWEFCHCRLLSTNIFCNN